MAEGKRWGEAQLTPVVQVRAYEAIVEQLKEEVLAGRLFPGARLPGERQLSETFGVSRASVREALRVLEALEVIVVNRGNRQGSGLVVNSSPGKALATLLSFEVALGHFTMRDVVRLRALLERSAVQEAARGISPEHGARLEGLIAAMRGDAVTREEFHAFDTEFHVGIAEASGNGLIAHLMHALRDSIERKMMQRFEREDWPVLRSQLVGEHQALFDAITAGDADRAMEIVEAHITDFYETWLATDAGGEVRTDGETAGTNDNQEHM